LTWWFATPQEFGGGGDGWTKRGRKPIATVRLAAEAAIGSVQASIKGRFGVEIHGLFATVGLLTSLSPF
jgi:hypothetical protein